MPLGCGNIRHGPRTSSCGTHSAICCCRGGLRGVWLLAAWSLS